MASRNSGVLLYLAHGLNMQNNLIIYNLATDLESDVLSAAHDWICEFSLIYDYVLVFSTIVGKYNLPPNCKVHAIGGRSTTGIFSTLQNLIKSIFRVLKLRGKKQIFYHMNHKAAIIVAPIFKLLGIKQILWYSHSKNSIGLKIASLFVDYCVSTNSETFPFKSRKFVSIGHGIDQNKFNNNIRRKNNSVNRTQIIASGRVVPIKKIERMIEELDGSNVELVLLGSQPDSDYSKKLEYVSNSSNVKIKFLKPIPFFRINDFYSTFNFAINCTPKSVDKAILEASMCGCIPISDNINVLKATGMFDYWEKALGSIPIIRDQLKIILEMKNPEIIKLALKISTETSNRNALHNTIQSLSKLFS